MLTIVRIIQKLSLVAAVMAITFTCAYAGESYEDWRNRTGGTSVAEFYTEHGLEKTCHGFWARNYVETDPNSPCFQGTTNAGLLETNAQEPLTDAEPAPLPKVSTEETLIEPLVVATQPAPDPQQEPVKKDEDTTEPPVEPENPVGTIVAGTGTETEVPATTPQAITFTARNPSAPILYGQWVVGTGEHLWGISAHSGVYGDPHQWPLLFKKNRHQIKDADLLYPGQVLEIERDLDPAEIQRAIDHATTRGAWALGITELSDLEYLSRERGYQ